VTFEGHEADGPIIRDRRRIDPLTGEVREPRTDAAPEPVESAGDDATAADAAAPAGQPNELDVALAERTADLQRLQAEYVNYKRRVDRDREVTRETAIASVLTQLLPVLDDIGRAREHGELTGGFKAVAESLQRAVTSLGLETFGEVGDEFDPRIHEALMHAYSDDVDGPVSQAVLQVGYRLGERVLRPARVAVVEPSVPAPADDPSAASSGAAAEPAETASSDPSSNDLEND
jgi:molecular chaperone GrpE